MKQKLTIFQQRKWEKVDDQSGDTIVKYFYAAFPEKGKPLEFATDRDDIEVHEGLLRYDAGAAEEIDLEAVFDSFKGLMKFREIGSGGK
jgi:hypothetical protein